MLNLLISLLIPFILDTDCGPDYDDVGALAMMHALADSTTIQPLAVMASNQDWTTVPCIRAINTYYGRPDLPVGYPSDADTPNITCWHPINWTRIMAREYLNSPQAPEGVGEYAVDIYRRCLSQAADTSVVICAIGFSSNLAELLRSGPDKYSPLSGEQLVAQKVKRLVIMAGCFPDGREFNVGNHASAAKLVADRWPTEIIYSGQHIGNAIYTGKPLINDPTIPDDNPVKRVYSICMSQGDPDGRQSWDQTAVLVACLGWEPYFTVEEGRFSVDSATEANHWEPLPYSGPQCHRRHLTLNFSPDYPKKKIVGTLHSLMRHEPIVKK